MEKIFNANGCPACDVQFQLTNNFGFIPLYTQVYLDLQNGTNTKKPIAKTPPYLTDASIPRTAPFTHYGGCLICETYLSYGGLNKTDEEIKALIGQLQFDYTMNNSCDGSSQTFTGFGLGPYFITSKQVVYFVTFIDIV